MRLLFYPDDGTDAEGPIDEVFTGLSAQAVQHEMDHLNGIFFIEKMGPEDRKRIAPQLRELAKLANFSPMGRARAVQESASLGAAPEVN